ncbi:MAG: hypothetical protein JXR68_04550 [Bacteroidales bacterium]|nr:hypothetical protein [Bacteroidales bacterium]
MKIKYLLFACMFLFSSCIGVKFKGKKSPKQFYEVFYMEQDVLQYFIKPIDFKGDDNIFRVDFTFRDSSSNTSLVTTNYSIYSPEVVKQIDSSFFVVNNQKIKLKNPDRLFIDLRKTIYQIRYSSVIEYDGLVKITSSDPEFWAYYNGSKHVFYPTKRTYNILSNVKTQIIDIIEFNKN